MTKKEMTKEEAAEEIRKDRISNLESLLPYVGSNHLSVDMPYGKEGANAGKMGFNNFLMTDKASQIRNQIYLQKVQEAQKKGNSGYKTISAPEYNVTNNETEMGALGLVQDAQLNLKLRDLGKIVKKIAPGIKDKLDKVIGEFGEMKYLSLLEKEKKAEQEGKEYTPTMEEEQFAVAHGLVSQAYKRFAGLSLLNESVNQNYNAIFDQFLEGYKNKKEESAKKPVKKK